MLTSLSTPAGDLLAIVWGFVLIAYAARCIRRRSRSRAGDDGGFNVMDTDYWRMDGLLVDHHPVDLPRLPPSPKQQGAGGFLRQSCESAALIEIPRLGGAVAFQD